ncbi:hypothetical protein CCMA1212_009587 [Trichoderma ghanense]|uniref:Uncharacterized protein n=1 Tax=Trichoderma ghanense TaxID=65468 RepID=A0ABY2GSX0_9HYPO
MYSQVGAVLQVQINLTRRHTTLVDAPDNEGLAAASIARSKHALHVGAVLAGRRLDVLASVLLNLVAEDASLGSKETHGQQDEVGREELLGALNLLHVPTAARVLCPLDTDGVDALDLATAVIDKLLGHDAVLSRILAVVLANLRVAVVDTVDSGPLGPRVVVGTLIRRLGQQLKVVVSGITTANDNDVLALGRDVRVVRELGVEQRLGVLVQELHGIVDALKVASLDGKIASNGGTSSNDDGVVAGLEVLQRWLALGTNGHARLEVDALGGHEVGSALDDALVQLHVRDSVHQETTQAVGALVHGHGVASSVELVSTGQTGGTGPDNGNLLASADLGDLRHHPTHLETTVDDGALNRLDTDRVAVDAQDASSLAGGGADTASELGEVVGHEQTVERVLPLVLEHKLVPLGNDVGDGAAGIRLTEGDTAVHAAGRLVLELVLVETGADLGPVLDSGGDRAVLFGTASVLHEALGLVEHQSPLLLLRRAVANGLFHVLELGSLVLLLGVHPANCRQVVLGTLGLGSLGSLLLKHTLVVRRKDLDESRQGTVEVDQDACRPLRARVVVVVLNETANVGNLDGVCKGTVLNHLGVELGDEVLVDVQHVRNTAGHARSKVAASAAQDDNSSTSHVLATVVTDALDNGRSAGVADGESLGSDTTEVADTTCRTVQADVADQDVLFSLEDGRTRRVDNQATTRQALADVVVGITLQLESDTWREERTKGLAGRALDVDVNSVKRETLTTISLGDLVRQRSAHGTIGVDNVALNSRREALVKSQLGLRNQLVVQSDVELVVLLADVEGSDARSESVGGRQQQRQVNVGSLLGAQVLPHLEDLNTANHLVDGSETKLGHDGSKLVGDVVEEVDDVLRSTGKLLAELGVLGSDTHGAGVQMAFAHHDAAHGDQGSSSETPLLSTEQAGNSNISASSKLTVSLHHDTASQVVENQSLVSLGKTQLPGETSVLDTSPSGGTGTTVVARDEDVVSLGLGHARGDNADTDLRHKLDRHARARARALEVVNQLLEILNGVDVVVRRGRDETDAGSRVSSASNGLGDLVARQLATLARLGALGHLDLELIRVGKVGRRDTESTRGDLLDSRAHGIAVGKSLGSLGILTTFTGVGLAAQSVHGDGERRVRLHGDGAVRHGTGAEASDDVGPWLDLVNGHRLALIKLEVKQATQRARLDLLVLASGVGLVRLVVLGANCILQVSNGSRVVDVSLAAVAPVVFARLGESLDANSVA